MAPPMKASMKSAAMKKTVMKKKVMRKVMKVTKATKSMKKAMKISTIARGKRARASVFRGTKEKTASGMTKASLVKNKRGKIVSKKAQAAGRKKFAANLSAWNKAVMAARRELGIKGFAPVGGKTAQGKAPPRIERRSRRSVTLTWSRSSSLAWVT
jgi:hypothetical protein